MLQGAIARFNYWELYIGLLSRERSGHSNILMSHLLLFIYLCLMRTTCKELMNNWKCLPHDALALLHSYESPIIIKWKLPPLFISIKAQYITFVIHPELYIHLYIRIFPYMSIRIWKFTRAKCLVCLRGKKLARQLNSFATRHTPCIFLKIWKLSFLEASANITDAMISKDWNGMIIILRRQIGKTTQCQKNTDYMVKSEAASVYSPHD